MGSYKGGIGVFENIIENENFEFLKFGFWTFKNMNFKIGKFKVGIGEFENLELEFRELRT